MLKKFSVVLSVLAVILMFASKPAQASITMYYDLASWGNAASPATGPIYSLNLSTYYTGTIPTGTIIGPNGPGSGNDGFTFLVDLTGSGTPVFLYTGGSSLVGTFTNGQGPLALGLEMEPNSGTYSMGLTAGGVPSTTIPVTHGSPQFFGWVSNNNEHVDSMSLSFIPNSSTNPGDGFEFGNIVYTSDEGKHAVPEPASLSLLGLGLLGLGFRRKKAR